MATWHDVSRCARALPEVHEDVSSQGRREWRVRKKLFAWERPLRRSDLDALGDEAPTGAILGLRTADLEMKDVLLSGEPDVYFTTPHFDGYAAVLVRLGAIARGVLEDALIEAWLARAPKRAAAEFLNRRRATLRLP
jgi:hypothetical protein